MQQGGKALPSLGQPPGCQEFPQKSSGRWAGTPTPCNILYEEVSKCFEDSVEAEDMERDAVEDRAGVEWAVWAVPKPPDPADTVCALTVGTVSPTRRASRATR